ncbi:hypothetical protein ACTGJ9_026535 [Bradyrhizobium sp. RDM12]
MLGDERIDILRGPRILGRERHFVKPNENAIVQTALEGGHGRVEICQPAIELIGLVADDDPLAALPDLDDPRRRRGAITDSRGGSNFSAEFDQ